MTPDAHTAAADKELWVFASTSAKDDVKDVPFSRWKIDTEDIVGNAVAAPEVLVWGDHPPLRREAGLLVVTPQAPAGLSAKGERPAIVTSLRSTHGSGVGVRGDTVDARLLEDRLFEVFTEVNADDYSARTPKVAYQGAEIPLSRGKPCRVEPAEKPPEPCALTDGSLSGANAPFGKAQVDIDLGAVAEIGLVVVPESGFEPEVSVSADGMAWTLLPGKKTEGTSRLFTHAPERPIEGRWVRVVGFYPVEVSVWGPAVGDDGQRIAGLLERDGEDSSPARRWPAAAVATLLLLAVSVATLGATWRWRSPAGGRA